jgi:gamma-glutamyltranspeptidase/glutathione hydrolase
LPKLKGAVAAGHRLTAETAAEILKAGGNAFDAAVAAFFTMCVCEPVLSSFSGGGFLLARERGGTTRLFDFFTHTPRAKIPSHLLDFYPVTVDFGSTTQDFHIGVGASATPGTVSGMFSVNKVLGSMDMRELVQPAVELARSGVVVDEFQAYLLGLVSPMYKTESLAPLFAGPDGSGLVTTGDVMKNPDLAQVMEVLALEGRDLFYRGEIAQGIQALCDGRGHLRYDDFINYETVERSPLSVKYRDHMLFTNPPPSAGGALIGFGLNLLSHFNLSGFEFGDVDHIRMLAEVLVGTSAARAEHFKDGPHSGLLDQRLVESYRQKVSTVAASYKGTTHISVVDAEGNIAAMTVSNGEGCGELLPGTGIVMNNMLGEEDLNPAGFHNWNCNERMSSMMAPAVLVDRRGGMTAMGSGGSNRIRTAILQVVSNMVDFGQSARAATDSARIHIETEVLNIEPGLPGGRSRDLLAEYPEHRLFDQPNMFFGGVHSAGISSGGSFHSYGDARRSGAAVIVGSA